MNKKSILLLGSIALDTIKTKYGTRKELLGGSATYAAIASSPFVKVNLVGIIGNDFPVEGEKILEESCNSTKDLVIEEGETFRWGGEYHENGDDRDTLFTNLGVFENFSPKVSSVNSKPDFIFLANIHPELQLSILKQCQKKATVITDSMNLWIDIARDSLLDVLEQTDILLINQSEVYDLTNNRNMDQSISQILEMGPKTIIVKYGSNGSKLYNHNGVSYSIGVINVPKVIDPTGAGDSYGGGLVSGLAEGLTIKDAMLRGTVMASLCIENFGTESIYSANHNIINERIKILSNS